MTSNNSDRGYTRALMADDDPVWVDAQAVARRLVDRHAEAGDWSHERKAEVLQMLGLAA